MNCKLTNEQYTGVYNFLEDKREGKAIVVEHGKEFFVEYDEKGKEIQDLRKRTFEGIRLMIVGNRFLFFNFFLKKKFFIYFLFY
jgi:hypothetical protein